MTKSVAIIGAGLIGQAWAIVFARAGWSVRLWDEREETLPKAIATIESLVSTLETYKLIERPSDVLSRIAAASSMANAVEQVQYVQENVSEDVSAKRKVFAQLDSLVDPSVVLASSTSGIPTSSFSEDLRGRARCLVAHPANPPYLLPVVEISGAPWTSPEAIAEAEQLMRTVGQRPIVVKKEIEGFILNRLQAAVLREAFRLVQGGYVDAEGLDATFREGLGLRWSFMGPFETIDLNAPGGLSDYCARYGELYRRISEKQTSLEKWPQEFVEQLHAERRVQVREEDLVARRLWRDRRLMALAAHKKTQDEAENAPMQSGDPTYAELKSR
jgi:3-hydroxyacyl-CoA dehydrogenase